MAKGRPTSITLKVLIKALKEETDKDNIKALKNDIRILRGCNSGEFIIINQFGNY